METIGYLAGALSLVGYLPQTVKTIRTRQTDDLSLPTFIFVGVSALLWVIFGFSEGIPAIWLTNGVVFVCTATIAVIKLQNKEV